ncbi:WD40 domain containing protein [Trichuris trichiura]|uniref:Elongator complex protein 2 n=1 Tax=Trichuris trichiura TaxID=36087 RepID=A0A077Z4J7_TRITR|nr:WD40 domain containing protein [Trichuris trichiura]
MPTGHFSAVNDLAWDPHGMYLLSCSADRTSRLFAEWKVSGSKVRNVSKMFHNNAKSATVATLGLTNRPVYEDAVSGNSTPAVANADDITLEYPVETEPLHNDYLAQKTLWPEIQKLYGHGFEIFSVASNHAGTVVASACKASRPEHAAVILWSVDEGVPKSELTGHRLTVTRIAFSPDDSLLLTVSRDRKWCLFRKQSGDFDYAMVLIHSCTKCSHTRVIWDCAWAPCGNFFFTASRDKRAIAWQFTLSNGEQPKVDVLRTSAKLFEDSVTAIDVIPCHLMSLCDEPFERYYFSCIYYIGGRNRFS